MSQSPDPFHSELQQWLAAAHRFRAETIVDAMQQKADGYQESCVLARQSTDMVGKIAVRFPSLTLNPILGFARAVTDVGLTLRKIAGRRPSVVDAQLLADTHADAVLVVEAALAALSASAGGSIDGVPLTKAGMASDGDKDQSETGIRLTPGVLDILQTLAESKMRLTRDRLGTFWRPCGA